MSSTTIYCTYLTIYSGNKLPPFYIGSSTVQRVESGYRGSVVSKKYKSIWKNELKENPDLFKTKIISLHETVEESRAKELKFQRELNVVESTLYINQAYASVNGYFGVVSGKDHPCYGKTGENNPMSKTFWAISPDGIKYIANGIRQFARLHNLCPGKIVRVLKGKHKHHKNWTFGYIEKFSQSVIEKTPKNISGKNPPNFDHSIYKFFNTATQEIFEGQQYNFIRTYDLSQGCVNSLIHGRYKSHRNWILVEKLS